MYELLFDLIIAAIVGGIPVALVAAHRSNKLGALHVALGAVWLVVVYGSFIEPQMLVVKEYSVDLSQPEVAAKRTMNLAVVSDFHLGTYRHREWVERVVAAVNAQRPDVVLLAGDLVSDESGFAGFAPLADLKSQYGTFAVLGNWDYKVGAVDVRHAIEQYRVEVLTDESVVLGGEGSPVRLIGLDDVKFGTPDWDVATADIAPGELPVLLAHNPDAVSEAEVRGIPLVISGHTHGGQVRLPFIGPVPPLPTLLGRRYDRGVLHVGPVTLFITPGVGESGPRARLFQPPEVSILHLTY